MHSPASASARVEVRPGIGISALRRFLLVVSTQMLARNLTVFEIFLSLFELYKFSTLLHRSTFVFSAFRALPPFSQILQAPPHPSRSFPKIAYRLVGRPKRCKMPSNAFLFCYNRCRSRCPRAKGQRAEESATQPSFSIFSFFYFSFLRFFSPSFRVRPPRTVFLLGFPRTVRPSRAVSILLGRLFSALLCSRRAGQHALPQSTVGGRHRPCVSHGSKPAVATESLPNGLVSISPTVSVE